MDEILTYPTDSVGALAAEPSHRASLPPGTGPRHHTRHPSGQFLFTCGEINSTLNVLEYDEDEGKASFLEAYSSLPRDYPEGASTTAQVVAHPNGKAVYVSNRGHESIAAFSFDESTGKAEFLGTQPTFGRVPRNFDLDPTATFLIAANQNPGNLIRFRLNAETFWPEPDNFTIDSPSPACIVFRPIPE